MDSSSSATLPAAASHAGLLLRLPQPNRQEELERTWQEKPGLIGWLTTTNHKSISIRYIITAFCFFLAAGVLALLMRIQLAHPELHFLGPDLYNQLFTVHGT